MSGLGCREILGVKIIFGTIVKNIAMTNGYTGGLYWGRAAITIPFDITGYFCIQLTPQAGGLPALTVDGTSGKTINILAYNTEQKTTDIPIHVLVLAF